MVNQYIQRAYYLASLSPLGFQHGAVVVKGKTILGESHNDHSPHFYGDTCHAESSALRKTLGGRRNCFLRSRKESKAD